MVTGELSSCVANDRLHLVLMPTEACNFRCSYCYEDFRYARMEAPVLRGIKRLLSRRAAGLSLVELSWFGGEPLLAMDIIEDVSRHVGELQRVHSQLRCSADITTNAYLLSRARFERLLSLGIIRFQISFDGLGRWHDRKRVLANGQGTFDRIWANVLALRGVAQDFHVLVRVHVDRENYRTLPEFIRQYADAFGVDERFQLFIRRLACLGGPHDGEMPVFDEETGKEAVRELSRRAEELGVRHVTIEEHAPICYASRGNSFVIRANGRLNKCTVALEHPNNQVGRIGEDGLLDFDVANLGPWMRGLWSGDREELECPMRGYADPGTSVSFSGKRESRQPNVLVPLRRQGRLE